MRRVFGALLLLLLSLPSTAIIVRHDQSARVSNTEGSELRAIGKVLPDGESVLVAPEWVLTAAHVATGAPLSRLRVRFFGIDYRVVEVVAYPDWKPGDNDIALMRLAQPVARVQPFAIDYTASLIPGESRLWLAGRGDFGDGLKGVVGNDGGMRLAQNLLAELSDGRIIIKMEAPDAGAIAREGISGPGDSGTPILLRSEGGYRVVGIGSVGATPDGVRYGQYGSEDCFIRVAHVESWLEKTIREASANSGED